MLLFWIATAISVVIVVFFVIEGVLEFAHLRRRALSGEPPEVGGELTADRTIVFSAKAAIGTVASFLCIVLISTQPAAWVLMPALSLGSAIAVIVAFWVDRRSRRITAASAPEDSSSVAA